MYYWCVFPLNDFTAKYTSCLLCKISFATSRGMGEVYPATFWKLKKVPWFWEKRFWLPSSMTNISRLKCCFSRENVEIFPWWVLSFVCYGQNVYWNVFLPLFQEASPVLKNTWLSPSFTRTSYEKSIRKKVLRSSFSS